MPLFYDRDGPAGNKQVAAIAAKNLVPATLV